MESLGEILQVSNNNNNFTKVQTEQTYQDVSLGNQAQ